MARALSVGLVLLFALLPVSARGAEPSGGVLTKPRMVEQARAHSQYGTSFRIPFMLHDEDLDDGRPAIVSIRIRNLLGQLVAVPTAVGHPDGPVAVEELEYTTPGYKEAFWHGLDRHGHRVASGVYLLELVVNGERAPPQKIVVDG
jgi:hypothetical protein